MQETNTLACHAGAKVTTKSFITLVPVGGDLLEVEVDKGLDSQRLGAVAGDYGVVLRSI
jgi:hypothetical protein